MIVTRMPGYSGRLNKDMPTPPKRRHVLLPLTAKIPLSPKVAKSHFLLTKYNLFIAPRNPLQQLLVRSAWDRALEDPPEQHLWAAAEAAPMMGTMTITVSANPGQREREATFALRTTVVQMARPAHRSATTPSAPPLTVVLAREIAPPTR
jgi:hypothetical protein